MDKTGCSNAQRAVIEGLPGPLFVAAGAGSGKTFTLKLRTANAFLPNESGFQLDSIDEVLAITFTKAAAAELLSRIKATLLEEGLQQQAFEADHAWISTIHGFCTRLLRENALEIGMDPEFRMITELEADAMRADAEARVLAQAKEGGFGLEGLAWNWQLMGSGMYDKGLIDDADALASKTNALPGGAAAFKHLAPAETPRTAMQSMIDAGQMLLDLAHDWEDRGGKLNGNTEVKSVAALPDAIAGAQEWLQSGQAQLDVGAEGFDAAHFRDVLSAFPALPATFGQNKDGADVVDRYKHAHVRAVYETDGAFGAQAAEAALRLSEAVQDEFARLKREAGVVDNDDLLRLTLDALQRHPALAQRCRDQFKLIMVDEFQDTDKVQIAILRLIAQPKLANVCVVGDAQQSIYRFRGADVGAFSEYRDALVADFPEVKPEELQPKLDQNFRSHADILAFVDAVFSQESSFGDDYLQLQPKGSVNKESDAVMDARPRVTLDIMHVQRGDDALKERALRESAQRIAQHFASIKQAYRDAGVTDRQSFALLLGKTKNAQVYIDALRAVGLESMMTSGSILMSSDEAVIMTALLRYALNTQDEQPLLDCLTSELFALSDDALVALAYRREGDRARRIGLARGFQQNEVEAWELSDADREAIQIARTVLDQYVHQARRGALSDAVRGVLVASGYLDRMQQRGVSGLAAVGNLSKLMDILRGVEQEQCGIAEVIAGFQAKTVFANESPGVLSVTDADFVQIMTIHGSKGLQFGHVALAEIKPGVDDATGLLAENEGASTYALSKKGFSPDDKLKAVAAAMVEERGLRSLADAETPGQLLYELEMVTKREALNEARRLLYVGLTRAVKSLFVSYVTLTAPNPRKGVPYQSDGVMQEVHEALAWDTDRAADAGPEACDYGGSRPAEVRFTVLSAEVAEETPEEGAVTEGPGAFIVPMRERVTLPFQEPYRGQRANLRSYTSLTHEEPEAPDAILGEEADASGDAAVLQREPGEDATSLGTAFHHLAQLAILQRAGELRMPDEGAIRAQEEKLRLSSAQRKRLREALAEWFASSLAEELVAYDSVEAEVPFMVRMVDAEGQERFLEGEIDALATTGDAAFLVDYKTGGSPQETEKQIREKHKLQAQCYAYALLRNGFTSVKATFVRVEQHLQTVTYEYTAAEVSTLESIILNHWQ